ncbi:hypothetical protein ACEUZ9_002886 [Paracoccus litorisediminis]|uniref:hypothetical protein n=1 Tax=Paracoccus litorisediminis TaxID=2006130 RepID=UPI003734B552
MRKRGITSLLLATCLAGFALPVLAQDVVVPGMAGTEAVPSVDGQISIPAVSPDDALFAVIERIGRSVLVNDVRYVDFFRDGNQAALVLTDDCEDDLCRWDFVAKVEGEYAVAGSAYAKNVSFEDTEGGGRVIDSDGVTWAWTAEDDWIMPWGSLADGLMSRKGDDREFQTAWAHDKYWKHESLDLDVYEMDLLENDWNQRLVLVGGICCHAGENGFPWLVIDEGDKVIASGVSIDPPHVFRRDGGGVTIVSQTVSGYLAQDVVATNDETEIKK